jgi:tetratricopeptide (TPR) repeat protein
MRKILTVSFLALFTVPAVLLSGCNQGSSPPPSTPPQSMQQPAMTPPQPPPLSLYMVPLDQSGFSMEKIQADKKMVEADPKNAQALVRLGDANFMIQRFEKSQEYYELALKSDPKNIHALLSLSNCFIFMQKPDEALRELDKILAIEKNSPEALFNKGLILLQSKRDPAAANQVWSQLVGVHPDHPLAQDLKGEMGRL